MHRRVSEHSTRDADGDEVHRIEKQDELLEATVAATEESHEVIRTNIHDSCGHSSHRVAQFPVPYGSLLEALSYVAFLVIFVLATVLLEHDDQAFYFSNRLKQSLTTNSLVHTASQAEKPFHSVFDAIQDQADVWAFLQGPFMDVVYPTDPLGLSDNVSPDQGMVLYFNRLLGGIRLRTLRVKPESCPILTSLPEYSSVAPFCYGPFSSSTEQTIGYGPILNSEEIIATVCYRFALEFFAPIESTKKFDDLNRCNTQCVRSCGDHFGVERFRYTDGCSTQCALHCKCLYEQPVGFSLCKDPNPAGASAPIPTRAYSYNWSDASLTLAISIYGDMGWLPGSGYIVDFPINSTEARSGLEKLKDNRFVDLATRALIIDFTLYNPFLQLFNIVEMVFEFPATGGAIARLSDVMVDLFRYSTRNTARIVLELVLVVLIVYRWFALFAALYRSGPRAYFAGGFWGYLEITHLISFSALIVVRVWYIDQTYGVVSGTASVRVTESSVHKIPAYQSLALLAYLDTLLTSVNAAIIWTKLLKYTQVSKRMCLLLRMLGRASMDLFWFLLYFIVCMCGFAQIGYLLFGLDLNEFKSLGEAIVTLLQAIAGDLDYQAMANAQRVVGPIFYIGFYFLLLLILLNVFLAILNDAYLQTVAEEEEQDELLMMDAMSYREWTVEHGGSDAQAQVDLSEVKEMERLRRYPFSRGITTAGRLLLSELRQLLRHWSQGSKALKVDPQRSASIMPEQWAARSTTSRKLSRQVKKHLDQQMEQQLQSMSKEQEAKVASHAARMDEINNRMSERLQGLIENNQVKSKRLEDLEKVLGSIEKLCQTLVLDTVDAAEDEKAYTRMRTGSRRTSRRQTVGAPAGSPRRMSTLTTPHVPTSAAVLNTLRNKSTSGKRLGRNGDIEEISL